MLSLVISSTVSSLGLGFPPAPVAATGGATTGTLGFAPGAAGSLAAALFAGAADPAAGLAPGTVAAGILAGALGCAGATGGGGSCADDVVVRTEPAATTNAIKTINANWMLREAVLGNVSDMERCGIPRRDRVDLVMDVKSSLKQYGR